MWLGLEDVSSVGKICSVLFVSKSKRFRLGYSREAKQECVRSECSSPVLFTRSVCAHNLSNPTGGFVCYMQQICSFHLLSNLHCRGGTCRHVAVAALLTVSPSMHFIGFEAMRARDSPPRTCVTLVPKYINKPRWLIRLEQRATGNTLKKTPLPEIQLWQFREDKPDKRPVCDERMSK